MTIKMRMKMRMKMKMSMPMPMPIMVLKKLVLCGFILFLQLNFVTSSDAKANSSAAPNKSPHELQVNKPTQTAPHIAPTDSSDASSDLHQLFEDYSRFNGNPDGFTEVADTTLSESEDNSPVFQDVSIEALQRNNKQLSRFLERLHVIDESALATQDNISYRLFGRMLMDRIEAFELGDHLVPLDGWWDFHASFAETPVQSIFSNTKDYEQYIKRLNGYGDHTDQYITRMRSAIEVGWIRPKVVLEKYIPTIEALVTTTEESLFSKPFDQFPASIPDSAQSRLREVGLNAVNEVVIPAYDRFARFMRDEYWVAAPENIAISNLNGGKEYYEHLVRHYTTLNITPDEVHQIGLDEVARIRQEMDEAIAVTDFEGTFEEFVHFLRKDPRFYATSEEELLQYTSLILKRMDGELPRLFKRLPRNPYGIREIPDHIAPRMTTAYYSGGAADGTRAGYYYVNTYDLASRPFYEVEALSFHEAVPGHHLQLTLQQELGELPKFRQQSGFTVFVEGWALYSERLGLELGFYQDPYSNFGRLTYEMWRALRLVVDTGMHFKGWGRQEAIDFMAANSALTILNITNEVDRYIFWPGQSLAYKTGEIKIRQLRKLAEEKLGENFDVREFHEVVLRNGSITLEVLEEEVNYWIATVSAE
jgi:uncharacterized protein (DUF885 family)